MSLVIGSSVVLRYLDLWLFCPWFRMVVTKLGVVFEVGRTPFLMPALLCNVRTFPGPSVMPAEDRAPVQRHGRHTNGIEGL